MDQGSMLMRLIQTPRARDRQRDRRMDHPSSPRKLGDEGTDDKSASMIISCTSALRLCWAQAPD